jgi:NADH:ubiquinone oxidoreductase subunit 2 (subunit N)
MLFEVLMIVTMTVNLAALTQSNVKRMLVLVDCAVAIC